jgi:hypothetical protein
MRNSIVAGVAILLFFACPAAAADPPAPVPTPPIAAPSVAAPAAPPPMAAGPAPTEGSSSPSAYPSYLILPIAPPKLKRPSRSWYGWQTLLVLGAATGVTIGIAATDTDSSLYAGLGVGAGMITLGGPIIHAAHGNLRAGVGSFFMYAGATGLNIGLALGIICGAGGSCGELDDAGTTSGIVIGGLVGLVTASIVDVSALAYKEKPQATGSLQRGAPGLLILPDFRHTREGTTFGVIGAF